MQPDETRRDNVKVNHKGYMQSEFFRFEAIALGNCERKESARVTYASRAVAEEAAVAAVAATTGKRGRLGSVGTATADTDTGEPEPGPEPPAPPTPARRSRRASLRDAAAADSSDGDCWLTWCACGGCGCGCACGCDKDGDGDDAVDVGDAAPCFCICICIGTGGDELEPSAEAPVLCDECSSVRVRAASRLSGLRALAAGSGSGAGSIPEASGRSFDASAPSRVLYCRRRTLAPDEPMRNRIHVHTRTRTVLYI